VVVKQQADPLSTVFCMGTRFSQKRFQPYDSTPYKKNQEKIETFGNFFASERKYRTKTTNP